MRRVAFSMSLGLVALLAGCPGRNTTPPEQPEQPAEVQPEAGPPRLAGLASFTADMLRRGAGGRTTAEIAEAIEYVGGDLTIDTNNDYTTIEIRVLREHLGLAMELLADFAQRPTFPDDEIERLRRQELDRLAMMQSRPRWLVQQAFRRYLYGPDHPYGHFDSEPASVQQIARENLVAFHSEHYVPRNAILVVVGDTDAASVGTLARERFASWEDRPAPSHTIPTPPRRDHREVVVVHQAGATQAQISIGNVALARSDPEYVPLRVANQVLGGSASARLFMNLRERCSYSYGVYSAVSSLLAQAPISAGGAVESSHTAGALREIFGELDRIRGQQPPQDELASAEAYMVGGFPIITETAGNLAELVTIQRVFGLPPDYWSTYRSTISLVTAEQAQAAAQQYIHPEQDLVVVVGDASQVAEPARRYGPVTVVTPDWSVVHQLDALPDQWPGGEPPACPALPTRDEASHPESPPAPAEARDMDFPDVNEEVLDNGLQVLTIERHQLPLAYARLVIRSGSAADPL